MPGLKRSAQALEEAEDWKSPSEVEKRPQALEEAEDWKSPSEVEKRPFDKLRAGLRRWDWARVGDPRLKLRSALRRWKKKSVLGRWRKRSALGRWGWAPSPKAQVVM
jgi:hypothetical protein